MISSSQGKNTLRGLAASKGKVAGKVHIIREFADVKKIDSKCVIVATNVNPGISHAIIPYAIAIVTETGGVLSHPAIIARELGIPCVVQVPEALIQLSDGMEVIVNGTDGTVTIQ